MSCACANRFSKWFILIPVYSSSFVFFIGSHRTGGQRSLCLVKSVIFWSNLALKSRDFKMTRGNQRELARAKNQKKIDQTGKKKAAEMKDGNRGMSLETRKHRDAEVMREKQRKAAEKKDGDGQAGSSTT